MQKQNLIMNRYKKLGYITNPHDEEGLHMFYSPYKIPEGLTKSKVRRAIDSYYKNGNKNEDSYFNSNRLSIFFNKDLILGASIVADRPNNSRELNKLLRSIIKTLESRKKLIDTEVF